MPNIAARKAGAMRGYITLLALERNGHADFFDGRRKVNSQFGANIGKAHKPNESENCKDKQKLEEFA